jgi:ribosomal protein RSM22 (predicted rRNA methylase)
MGEMVGENHLEQKFIKMYSSIIKVLPDLQIDLPDYQVFCSFAAPI